MGGPVAACSSIHCIIDSMYFGANLSTFGHVYLTRRVVLVDTWYFDGVARNVRC